MLESLVRVLLSGTMTYVIGQVGTVTSYPQQVLTDLFPIVPAARQTYLERKRGF